MTNVSAVEKMAELMQQMEENSPRVAAFQYCLTLVAEKVEEAEKRNAELESRYSELAAELRAVEEIHNEAVFITDEHYEQCPPEVQKIIRSLAVMQIPAYQAFLAEVRAQGVERLANAWYAIANETDPGISISDSSRLKYRQRADDAADFANEIRQEAAQ
ncbi:hypothetical protein ACX27D_08445 [Enterobacter hormaechei]|uniref:hypothetical protein n=1 Tax=Enterobacter hormaechei TaxID=158836 RepID=UPI001F39E06F|nr:hypothetical protein [Enterobacter hormaechei]